MGNIIKFSDGNKELFIFEWDGKIATIAPELIAFEGYKDVTSSWRDIKNREGLKEKIDFITFKNAKLKLFKKYLKTINSNSLVDKSRTLYEQYRSVPRIDLVFIDKVKHILNTSDTQESLIRRFRMKRYEEKTIPYIIESFKDVYNPIYQYKVGNYFIDLYIPELNLAIECDENGHRFYDKQKELEREQYIKNKLGCEFIRYNPNDKNFKVIDVVNEIIKYTLKVK